MVFTYSNKYISKPICIGEFSLDRNGNVLQNKIENKCYLYEKFINQDTFFINLKSHKILFEDKTIDMELNLRRNILNNLKISTSTLDKSLCNAEFYCSSGILTKFATSHLHHSLINVWCIKIDNVIVMVDSNTLEKKRSFANDNITLSTTDSEIASEQNKSFISKLRYDRILKYAAFLKRNCIDNKKVFIDGIHVWKQYRRVYVSELQCPSGSGEDKSIKIAYNSIIHCVDKKTDNPVIIKIRPSHINEEDFIWKLNQLSKMYMQTILLNSNKIVIGECDKDSVIHQTKIKTPKEIFDKYSLNERNLYFHLWFVLDRIKKAFENESNVPIKCVNIVKWNMNDRYNVNCYADIPASEACLKVFDNF
ncbi:Hypothetical protein SRAE_2000009200 [Strongyloides ratti]|uniref:Decapping nuclease n=1 Tax=Strongyloides ratti TaxID=34506 RepID=A0A090L6P1_STRRB|nr:Hypothetical protein SRAE_2000009200 [Strongyloides ratti]CEF65412.1 Hypothetical protein SRAE_2000009200 [Strongyloides ratti]